MGFHKGDNRVRIGIFEVWQVVHGINLSEARGIRHRGTNLSLAFFMEDKNYTGVIPAQEEGLSFEAREEVALENVEEAKRLYAMARQRLLDVDRWHDIAGEITARFTVTDEKGQPVGRPVQEGDLFMIDIPAPENESGSGHDWVQVEAVAEVHEGEIDSTAVRVRPTKNPLHTSDAIAHFFSPQSTSTFTVTREGNKVNATIYDRNIDYNKDHSAPEDKLRNTAVGLGAKYGLAKLQWELLADALVKKEKEA